MTVTAEDLFAYIAGTAGHSGYTRRFAANLAERGARIPITRDPALWAELVEVGRRTVWIHTYGQRFASHHDSSPGSSPRLPPEEQPECVVVIGEDDGLPEDISYDASTRTLTVGTGCIRPVTPEVWDYRIGGVQVIRKWFSFRKRKPDVERQTPLNDILPPTWPARWTVDLIDLINAARAPRSPRTPTGPAAGRREQRPAHQHRRPTGRGHPARTCLRNQGTETAAEVSTRPRPWSGEPRLLGLTPARPECLTPATSTEYLHDDAPPERSDGGPHLSRAITGGSPTLRTHSHHRALTWTYALTLDQLNARGRFLRHVPCGTVIAHDGWPPPHAATASGLSLYASSVRDSAYRAVSADGYVTPECERTR